MLPTVNPKVRIRFPNRNSIGAKQQFRFISAQTFLFYGTTSDQTWKASVTSPSSASDWQQSGPWLRLTVWLLQTPVCEACFHVTWINKRKYWTSAAVALPIAPGLTGDVQTIMKGQPLIGTDPQSRQVQPTQAPPTRGSCPQTSISFLGDITGQLTDGGHQSVLIKAAGDGMQHRFRQKREIKSWILKSRSPKGKVGVQKAQIWHKTSVIFRNVDETQARNDCAHVMRKENSLMRTHYRRAG